MARQFCFNIYLPLFLHVGGKKVVIFQIRFLNLVHYDAPIQKYDKLGVLYAQNKKFEYSMNIKYGYT